jgi:putative transposase
LAEDWGDKYAVAVKSWEKNWEDLSTFFAYPAEIRRIIYTTNTVEAYHRQLRKVVKTKSPFPSPEAARKLLYLATVDITRKWTNRINPGPTLERPKRFTICSYLRTLGLNI